MNGPKEPGILYRALHSDIRSFGEVGCNMQCVDGTAYVWRRMMTWPEALPEVIPGPALRETRLTRAHSV